MVAGAHVFRLRREDPSVLGAYHGFPGGATQNAEVDVRSLAPQETVRIILTWTPQSITLYAGSPDDPTSVVQGDGRPSATQLRVDRRGVVHEVDSAVVHGPTIYAGGTELLGPPALELWATTMEVVRLLLLAESSTDGYMVEVALAQAALGAMVTGLETYCKTRFVELDGEGIPINARRVLARFGTKEERDALKAGQVPAVVIAEDVAEQLAGRINFQNLDDCKRAFKLAYGLRFGTDLDMSPDVLVRIRRLLTYRHRATHMSPLLALMNAAEPEEEPEFANKAFIASEQSTFDKFISEVHQATLRLRP